MFRRPLVSRLGALFAALFVVLIAAPAAGAIAVSLDRPDPFEPARGRIVIEAVVVTDIEIDKVVFYVDGMVVGQISEPPFRLEVDVGEENVEHRFEVVVEDGSGERSSARVETPRLRIHEDISVNLQQLYVTVTEQSGRRVLDLEAYDFALIDQGRRREIVTFARGDVPFTAVVLVDASDSMSGEKLQSALAGARAFFSAMRPLDEGRLLVFSDRILHWTPFTTFSEVLTAGLTAIEANGGTALCDHLYLALKQLEIRQGRRVVVLLSDGVDSHSVLSMTEVLDQARHNQALIYWLQLRYEDRSGFALPSLSSPWRNKETYQQEFERLREVVTESGGRVLPIASIAQIESAFEGIVAELREQYALGFEPAQQGGRSWRRLTVRVQRSGLDVRSRGGYLSR